jgi:hypothetical protein
MSSRGGVPSVNSGGCYCNDSRKFSTISVSLGRQSKIRNSMAYIECRLRLHVTLVCGFHANAMVLCLC